MELMALMAHSLTVPQESAIDDNFISFIARPPGSACVGLVKRRSGVTRCRLSPFGSFPARARDMTHSRAAANHAKRMPDMIKGSYWRVVAREVELLRLVQLSATPIKANRWRSSGCERKQELPLISQGSSRVASFPWANAMHHLWSCAVG